MLGQSYSYQEAMPLSEPIPCPRNNDRAYDVLHGKFHNLKEQNNIREDMMRSIEEEHGIEFYRDFIYRVSRIDVPTEIAKQYTINIIKHMHTLSKKLERKVDIHFASYDYFVNIEKLIKHPVIIEEQKLLEKEDCALKDELTGLFNRRYFTQELWRQIETFRRFGSFFSLLMADLDHFKSVNDIHSHQAGDEVLTLVAEILTTTARTYDRVTRYGGEEFAVILPHTSRKDSYIVAERMRKAVADQTFFFQGKDLGRITISIGIATYPIDSLDAQGLVRKADQALYVAKHRRNCTEAYCDYNRRNFEFNRRKMLFFEGRRRSPFGLSS